MQLVDALAYSSRAYLDTTLPASGKASKVRRIVIVGAEGRKFRC